MNFDINQFNKDDIKCIELELSTACNLKCPLCFRTNLNRTETAFGLPNKDSLENPAFQPSVECLIERVKQFKNLEELVLGSVYSEPTMYNNLFELIERIDELGIIIYLFTNGSYRDNDYHRELGKLFNRLNSKSKVPHEISFTVCGITQELHSKYRVNSKLDKVLENGLIFQNEYELVLQYLKFPYNSITPLKEVEEFFYDKGFKIVNLVDSSPFNEYIYRDKNLSAFNNLHTNIKRYTFLIKNSDKLKNDIFCLSKENSSINLNVYGKFFPCDLYRYYCKDEFKDYTKIHFGEYSFCQQCSKQTKKLINDLGIATNGWI